MHGEGDQAHVMSISRHLVQPCWRRGDQKSAVSEDALVSGSGTGKC